MKKHLFYLILSCLPILGFGQILQEGFNDITTLEGAGWTMSNQSSPLGTTGWFQGGAGTTFPGHQGGQTSYIGANFNNTAGGTGTISNWLITPTLNLKDGDKLSFYSRTATGSIWNDRLEVRSSVGTITMPSGAAGVGSFTNLHITINPDLNLSYPEVWTQYEVTVSGVGNTPVAMNFAFRYFVPNAGPSGTDSNFIGIDTLLVEEGGGGGPVEYCEVTYTQNVEPISRVIFAGIDNPSSPVLNGSPAMEDFTSISGNVAAGDSYEMRLEGNTDGSFTNTFTVFVDWNQDGDFTDAGEMYQAGLIANSNGTDGVQAISNIAVPEDALSGSTRMRIIKDWTLSGSPVWPSDPCGTYDYGQTEDYTLNVTGGGGGQEYCEDIFFTFDIEPITKVTVSNISNSSDPTVNGSPALEDFTSIVGNMSAGESYPIALEGNTAGNWTNRFVVFIDWNQNGVLNDAGEVYQMNNTITNSNGTDGQQALGTINVPANALDGLTRMRVKKIFGTDDFLDPCLGAGFGQVEDYSINVTGGGGGGPVDCSQSTPSNAFENGHGFLQSAHIAHDFSVDAGVTFTVEQLTLNILTQTATSDVTLSFYSDAGGQPGTLLYTTPAIVPTSITNIGTAFGFNVESTVVDLPVPQEFEGGASGANYFVAVTITNPGNSYWESTTIMNTPNQGFWSGDGGATWSALTGGPWDGVFEISGTCDSGGSTGEGCEWTVTVSDNSWGDEVSWQLRDAGGVVVLAGGPYSDSSGGYTDTQVVTAEGPVEFYIESFGTFNDNSPNFSIANENGVIINSTITGGTETTVSVSCDDGPPPPPEFDCEEQEVLSNGLENGLFFGGDTDQQLAVDIIVGDAGFTIFGSFVNVFVDGNTDLDFSVNFYSNNAGVPGTLLHSSPAYYTENEFLGNAFGFDVYSYKVGFENPYTVAANTTYWMEIVSDGLAWEATSASFFGAGLVFSNTNTGGVWTLDPATELVYDLICEELSLSDMSSSFDFAYYPNPVRDMLTIDSKKSVENVSVFNLAGQKVIDNAKVSNGQINVNALTPGTYVFRVTLEGGQVETFKIIKR